MPSREAVIVARFEEPAKSIFEDGQNIKSSTTSPPSEFVVTPYALVCIHSSPSFLLTIYSDRLERPPCKPRLALDN
jgi:hypothetical protein